MNPVLLFLIIVAIFFLWLLCSFLYKPIGKLFGRLIDEAEEAMIEDINENEKENEK